MVLSMSVQGSAMWVQRAVGGRTLFIGCAASDPAGGLKVSLTGLSFADDGVGTAFGPAHDGVAPRVFERPVEPVELRPVVVAPEDLRAVLLGSLEDRFLRVVVADEDPQPERAASLAQMPRVDAGWVGMRSCVGHV